MPKAFADAAVNAAQRILKDPDQKPRSVVVAGDTDDRDRRTHTLACRGQVLVYACVMIGLSAQHVRDRAFIVIPVLRIDKFGERHVLELAGPMIEHFQKGGTATDKMTRGGK